MMCGLNGRTITVKKMTAGGRKEREWQRDREGTRKETYRQSSDKFSLAPWTS